MAAIKKSLLEGGTDKALSKRRIIFEKIKI